ncbi:MAG: hypothetical protein ABSC55_11825 [Syntrophorhabdales bacterium]|jgi:hypothetical protein
MLKTLTTRKDIENAETRFAETILALSTESISVTIGYPGGSYDTGVMWLSSLGIWAHLGYPPSGKSKGKRYWNVFGIGKPAGAVGIVCEINFPREGTNRRTAGAFAEGDGGRLLVLHRGKLHSPGLDAEFFHANYDGSWVSVQDGGRETEFVLVATIGSDEFGRNLRKFVLEVDRIKNIVRNQT